MMETQGIHIPISFWTLLLILLSLGIAYWAGLQACKCPEQLAHEQVIIQDAEESQQPIEYAAVPFSLSDAILGFFGWLRSLLGLRQGGNVYG